MQDHPGLPYYCFFVRHTVPSSHLRPNASFQKGLQYLPAATCGSVDVSDLPADPKLYDSKGCRPLFTACSPHCACVPRSDSAPYSHEGQHLRRDFYSAVFNSTMQNMPLVAPGGTPPNTRTDRYSDRIAYSFQPPTCALSVSRPTGGDCFPSTPTQDYRSPRTPARTHMASQYGYQRHVNTKNSPKHGILPPHPTYESFSSSTASPNTTPSCRVTRKSSITPATSIAATSDTGGTLPLQRSFFKYPATTQSLERPFSLSYVNNDQRHDTATANRLEAIHPRFGFENWSARGMDNQSGNPAGSELTFGLTACNGPTNDNGVSQSQQDDLDFASDAGDVELPDFDTDYNFTSALPWADESHSTYPPVPEEMSSAPTHTEPQSAPVDSIAMAYDPSLPSLPAWTWDDLDLSLGMQEVRPNDRSAGFEGWTARNDQLLHPHSATPGPCLTPLNRLGRRDTSMDETLLNMRDEGLSYKQIKERGGFTEAESTLRGRYRTLTKAKEDRVRKPEWSDRNIQLLCEAVSQYTKGDPSVLRRHDRTPLDSNEHFVNKIPWKKVANYMADRGSYKYGNATVKKKYKEILRDRVCSGV